MPDHRVREGFCPEVWHENDELVQLLLDIRGQWVLGREHTLCRRIDKVLKEKGLDETKASSPWRL